MITERQIWKTKKAGAIDRLRLEQEPLNAPNDNQVQVKVKAVGLNFADIFALTGLYSATPKGAFIPGLEFSGVVEAIGKDIKGLVEGDSVIGTTRFGGYCSAINCDPDYLMKLPEGWSFSEGAAYPVQTLTAFYALRSLGDIKPNQKVLIHSAAGGVGLQAMKLVQAFGATPIGTVRSTEKALTLNKLGFENIIVREKPFKSQLMSLNQHYDLVLDAIGGEVQKASFDFLSPMGRLIVFGAAEFTPGKNRPNYLSALWRYLKRPKYDVMDMISANKSVMAFNLIWLWEQKELMLGLLNELESIQISPPLVGHEFPFEDAQSAIECLRNGNSQGKVVLIFR